jgi:hypothetical protein
MSSDARIVITPLESTALFSLELNTRTGDLYTTYTSNGGAVYAIPGVTVEELFELSEEADARDSWGSALANWKKAREEQFQIQSTAEFDAVVSGMHPKQKEIWLKLLEADVQSSR